MVTDWRHWCTRNSETAEDYTEMIADLIREIGEARAVDLAKHFGVTGPTVNSIIRRLVREGLVLLIFIK